MGKAQEKQAKSPVAILEHGLGPDHGPAGFLLNRKLGA